ncbi:hypothetical protein KBC99_03080 [Candidatus Saccharibacteria bacterium]|nr:hypothetical protein [Candidatus Saccharibacteria bacterium]
MKKSIRRIRRSPKNLIRDMRTIDELLDEMATKWAFKAERLNSLRVKGRQIAR